MFEEGEEAPSRGSRGYALIIGSRGRPTQAARSPGKVDRSVNLGDSRNVGWVERKRAPPFQATHAVQNVGIGFARLVRIALFPASPPWPAGWPLAWSRGEGFASLVEDRPSEFLAQISWSIDRPEISEEVGHRGARGGRPEPSAGRFWPSTPPRRAGGSQDRLFSSFRRWASRRASAFWSFFSARSTGWGRSTNWASVGDPNGLIP